MRTILKKAWGLIDGSESATVAFAGGVGRGLNQEKTIGVLQISISLLLNNLVTESRTKNALQLKLECKQALEGRLKLLAALAGGPQQVDMLQKRFKAASFSLELEKRFNAGDADGINSLSSLPFTFLLTGCTRCR